MVPGEGVANVLFSCNPRPTYTLALCEGVMTGQRLATVEDRPLLSVVDAKLCKEGIPVQASCVTTLQAKITRSF